MADAGVKGSDVQSWQAIFAPAGLPQPVIERLHRELAAVLQTSEVKQRLAQRHFMQLDVGPAAPGAFQREQIAKWAVLIKSANIATN